MLAKRIAPLVLPLCLMSWTLFAPAAWAAPQKPHHLVSVRRCAGVISAGDLTDGLIEISRTLVIGDNASSTCKYGSLTDGLGASELQEFSDGVLGVECLANGIKIAGRGGEAPAGGCYRLSEVTVFFITGSLAKKYLPKLEKGSRRRIWPSGYTRRQLAGVGSDAEYGYDGSRGIGYVQVVNASATIETAEIENMPRLVREAASTL